MTDSCNHKIIAQQDDYLIVKLILKEGDSQLKHKPKGITTIIPINGHGFITINGKRHHLEVGAAVNLMPSDEHSLFAETDLEVFVIEIL